MKVDEITVPRVSEVYTNQGVVAELPPYQPSEISYELPYEPYHTN